MIVEYLFSSSNGDIPLDPEDLARPFLITPEKAHPSLNLGDYFDTIRTFILKNRSELFKRALKGEPNANFDLENLEKILIRSEKHGILYHLASVEAITEKRNIKFTLSTAISTKSIDYLLQEHDILNRLNRLSQFSFLPEVYGMEKMTCHTAGGNAEEMVMLAAQWFEDYHEWHMARDPANGQQKLQIWDLKRGPRSASVSEASLIIQECSKILSLYYNFEDFSHIMAWHHAAGDFIINCQTGCKPDVRLTTVRRYAPLMADLTGNNANPAIAVVYFILDTTLRMRLDRLDGVGEKVWLDDFAVTATLNGLFEGLHAREVKEESAFSTKDLLTLLQSFDRDELTRVFEPLLIHYRERDSDEADFISARLDKHVSFLYQALQEFH